MRIAGYSPSLSSSCLDLKTCERPEQDTFEQSSVLMGADFITTPQAPMTPQQVAGQNEAVVTTIGGTTAAGAALGATVGTAVPLVGTAAGAALGAAVGAIAGLIGGFFQAANKSRR